jgi:hypothetical protein
MQWKYPEEHARVLRLGFDASGQTKGVARRYLEWGSLATPGHGCPTNPAEDYAGSIGMVTR